MFELDLRIEKIKRTPKGKKRKQKRENILGTRVYKQGTPLADRFTCLQNIHRPRGCQKNIVTLFNRLFLFPLALPILLLFCRSISYQSLYHHRSRHLSPLSLCLSLFVSLSLSTTTNLYLDWNKNKNNFNLYHRSSFITTAIIEKSKKQNSIRLSRAMPEQSNDYRVVVFGAGGVGKSSLVLRFIKGKSFKVVDDSRNLFVWKLLNASVDFIGKIGNEKEIERLYLIEF